MTEDIATLKAYVIDLERKVHTGTHSVEEIEKEKILIIHLISLHLNRLDTLHLLHQSRKSKETLMANVNEIDHVGEEAQVKFELNIGKHITFQRAPINATNQDSSESGTSSFPALHKQSKYSGHTHSTTKQVENQDTFSVGRVNLHRHEWLNDKINRELQDQLYVSEHLHNFKTLTKREREVIGYVTAGYQNKEISALLGITLDTVKQHRKAIRSKLGLDSIAALVRFGLVFKLKPEAL